MRMNLSVVAAALILGLGVAHADPADEPDAAATEDAAGSTIAPDAPPDEPAPRARATPAPFRGHGGRGGSAPQTQSSGGSAPEPSAPPAPTPAADPAPAPSSNFPPPSNPPPASGSPSLGGKIGSSWTPEGSGIPTLEAEYNKQQAAIKAGVNACKQKTSAALKNAKPREATGYPNAAQQEAANVLMRAAFAADRSFSVYGAYIYQMQECGATPAQAVQAWKDAALVAGRGDLKAGYWELNTGSHNTVGGIAASAYCGGYDFAPFHDCYRYPFGHTAIQCTFQPGETLRRASFGTDARGVVPAPFTAAWSDPNGPAVFNRPAIDMRKELTARLAYFDRLKGGLQDEGYDPQLIYVKIMTGQLSEKCEKAQASGIVDPGYTCGTFNGAGIAWNSAPMQTYRGKTLSDFTKPFSSCGDAIKY
jgi:hypothetical protein